MNEAIDQNIRKLCNDVFFTTEMFHLYTYLDLIPSFKLILNVDHLFVPK